MTGTIRYDHGEIAALTGEITRASTYFEGVLDELKVAVDRLGADWAGEAAPAYRMHQDQWNQAAVALKRLLAEISAATQSGNQNMEDADRRASRIWV